MGMFSWNWEGMSSERLRYRRTVHRMSRKTSAADDDAGRHHPRVELEGVLALGVAPRLAP